MYNPVLTLHAKLRHHHWSPSLREEQHVLSSRKKELFEQQNEKNECSATGGAAWAFDQHPIQHD
jgi:hypothetical protein